MSATVKVKGIEVSPDADALNDWEVLESIIDLQDEDANDIKRLGSLRNLLVTILGEPGFKKAKADLRKQLGQLKADDLADFVKELLEAISPES